MLYCNSNVGLRGSWGGTPAAGGYGGLGAKSPAAGRFFVIFEKKAVLTPLDHILHVFKAI